MSKEVAEEYASSLADLTVNSKPLINMLTILAEENIDHAGVIVETVEKHLEKVHPDIKLPVLYLVDSIIKNVGGAYTQKFSQSIVNMFTRTFKQVDEKIRSQMFKLRETWHDVFPATKLYQLDVKVNLIDPAWPIQAQPQQSNIHVNPNFLKKSVGATTSTSTAAAPVSVPVEEDEKMRSILAKKEQELLMLQRKKVEMELEHMRRQVEIAEKTVTKKVPVVPPVNNVNSTNNVPAAAPVHAVAPEVVANIPAKQRLGPPVNKTAGRIAPVSATLLTARRDPRLARHAAAPAAVTAPTVRAPPAAPVPPVAIVAPAAAIAPNVFDIKPLERVTKRKNVITIDVRPEVEAKPRRRDPRLDKRDPRRNRQRDERRREDKPEPERIPTPAYVDKLPDPKKISKMPPIPKISKTKRDADVVTPKRKRDALRAERRRRRDEEAERQAKQPPAAKPAAPVTSPQKEARAAAVTSPRKEARASPELVTFKELRNYHKEHYMRRNRQQSDSPEPASKPPPSVRQALVWKIKCFITLGLFILTCFIRRAPLPRLPHLSLLTIESRYNWLFSLIIALFENYSSHFTVTFCKLREFNTHNFVLCDLRIRISFNFSHFAFSFHKNKIQNKVKANILTKTWTNTNGKESHFSSTPSYFGGHPMELPWTEDNLRTSWDGGSIENVTKKDFYRTSSAQRNIKTSNRLF